MTRPSSNLAPDQRLLTPAERRRLHEAFDGGRRALLHGRATEAAELLTRCVVEDPGNVLYVAAFLDCLKSPGKPAGFVQRFGLMRREWRFRKAVAASDWSAVVRLGPDLLVHRPDDPFLLSQMAEACRFFRFREVELAWLRWATTLHPNHAELLRQMAQSLARKGHFDESLAVWRKLAEVAPDDPDAHRAIARWESDRSGSAVESASSPIQTLRQAVAKNPTDVEVHRQLADALSRQGLLDDAEQTLRRAIGLAPGNLAVIEGLEQLQLDQIRRQCDMARELAVREPGEETAELLAGLETEFQRRELEIADARSRRHPADSDLKLKAAHGLRQSGNYREAARRLAEIESPSPEYPLARLEIGECLQRLRQFPAALERYLEAIEAAESADHSQVARLARQRAATLAEAMGDVELAQRLRVESSAADD